MVAGEMLALTEAGRTAVNDSVGAMDRIADRVGSISSSTTSLGDKVMEIGGILALLDDLSDQTNLLALNAAIEAARAGEHGRGFAVVAGEVRKLAERARESTGRIQSLVAEIQHLMTATLSASEQGALEVELGSGLASDAVGVLEQIASRVEEAATAVKEISVATQQQRSASDQVVVVMTRLSEVSSEYAAGFAAGGVVGGRAGCAGRHDELVDRHLHGRGVRHRARVGRGRRLGRPLGPRLGRLGARGGRRVRLVRGRHGRDPRRGGPPRRGPTSATRTPRQRRPSPTSRRARRARRRLGGQLDVDAGRRRRGPAPGRHAGPDVDDSDAGSLEPDEVR